MQAYFNQLEEVLVAPNFLIAVILFVLISGWIGMGAWTAVAAERRRHSPIRFFLYSLLLPGYHLRLLLKEPEATGPAKAVPGAEVVITKKLHFPQGDGAPAVPGQPPEPLEEKAPAPAPAFNADFFKRTQDQVTPETPWRVAYSGTEIEIVGIREIMAEVAVVVIQVPGTQTTRRIRVPFAKVTEMRPVNRDT